MAAIKWALQPLALEFQFLFVRAFPALAKRGSETNGLFISFTVCKYSELCCFEKPSAVICRVLRSL